MGDKRTIEVAGIAMEFRVDAQLAPSAIRTLAGLTPGDQEVDALSVPSSPRWLATAVRLLRWYRAGVGTRFAQRCVFEPSCSRYAELALRRCGAIRGTWLTMLRLWRCRPGKGGIDLP